MKRLLEHNSALLAKWWWRYSKEKEALWVKVISRKYNLGDEVWLPTVPNRGKASVVWQDLCSVGDIGADMGECIIQGFRFKVNSGSSIKFWHHKWLGEEPLLAVFPILYRISIQKEAMISEVWGNYSQETWNLQFRRPLRIWEVEQLNNLKQLLSVVHLQDSGEDSVQWRWSKDLSFSVKSAYAKWEDQSFMENKELRSIWKNICPPKVELFVWMAVQNCIASKSVLVRRGMLVSEFEVCPLCNSASESPNHLLLLCQFAWRVWSEIIAWWKLEWICPPNLLALLQFWDSFKFKNLERIIWQACFYTVMWTIWTTRNKKVFSNEAVEVEEVIDLSKTRMAIWVKGKYGINDYSVDDFKRCLDGIRKVRI